MKNTQTEFQAAVQWDHVRRSFPEAINLRIDRETDQRIDSVIDRGSDAAHRQIVELEREWDIDRALMAFFALLGGATVGAGALKSRRWLMLTGVQLAFLLIHATKGWCPPASLFRRLGFRTQKEIQAERYTLIQAQSEEAQRRSQRREAA